jgi:hypothetical protein
MARNLIPLLVVLALTSCGPSAPNAPSVAPAQLPSQSQPLQPQQAQSSPALVGNWSANVNFGTPGGLMITDSFTNNGLVQSTVTTVVRGLTMSYMLSGVYQFDAAQNTLSYKWQDFSPKQICIGGNCTPAQPPAPMGVTTTNSIRFLGPNEFVATSNGASTTYVRTNGAGFPTS